MLVAQQGKGALMAWLAGRQRQRQVKRKVDDDIIMLKNVLAPRGVNNIGGEEDDEDTDEWRWRWM